MGNEDVLLSLNQSTHAFQKVEGMVALERPRVLFEGEVLPGDLVDVFYTPAGNFILSKSVGDGLLIKSITNAYVCFEDNFSIQEV